MNTIQLLSKTDAKLYSVQVRDKDTEHRSFVQITDKTISSDDDGYIISRNAICYVDTCKYDSRDINISCKHVKSALEPTRMANPLQMDISVWYSMALDAETKHRLWNVYREAEYKVPMVQRITQSQFVVKCDTSSTFPAGRLHVALTGGGVSSGTDHKSNNITCSCACKKLKILMSPNNSVVLESDKCEHIFITIAAILSNTELKVEFSKHIELFHDMFKPADESLDDCMMITEVSK